MAAGETFWPHYLIALIPTRRRGHRAGRAPADAGRTWTRRLVVAAAVATALVSSFGAVHVAMVTSRSWTIGRWLAASAAPRDSVVVTFTHANLINASGLRPSYQYAWSLPIRTLDPHLNRWCTRSTAPPPRPGWSATTPRTPWGLDPTSRVAAALRTHYREVATVCGRPVWLTTRWPARSRRHRRRTGATTNLTTSPHDGP